MTPISVNRGQRVNRSCYCELMSLFQSEPWKLYYTVQVSFLLSQGCPNEFHCGSTTIPLSLTTKFAWPRACLHMYMRARFMNCEMYFAKCSLSRIILCRDNTHVVLYGICTSTVGYVVWALPGLVVLYVHG